MLLSDFSFGYWNTQIPHSYSNTSFSTFLISFINKTYSFFAETVFSFSPPHSYWASCFHCLCCKPPGQIHVAGGGRRTAEAGTGTCLSCQSPLDSDAMWLHSPFVICSCSAFGFQHLSLSPHPLVSLLSSLSSPHPFPQDPKVGLPICLFGHDSLLILIMLTLAPKRLPDLLMTCPPPISVSGSGFCCLSLAACLTHIVLLPGVSWICWFSVAPETI